MDIVIYSTGACPYCVQAKQLLASKGANFKEIRIDLDPVQRDIMLQKSNGKRTVPQIFIGNTHIGGFDDLAALNRTGKLYLLLSGS